MKTIKQASIKSIYVEFMPENMEQGEVYVSKRFMLASHLCLCGCGSEVVMPLDEIVTENEKFVTEMQKGGWILTEKNGKVSFSPSIENYNFPCKSHYIIANNVANFV